MTEEIEVEVGPVAHGGHCVARWHGRVVFVRHALPGERVRARITETRGSFLRAEAVSVLEGSPDRVEPPCPYAGPGRCGGCDFQHVRLPAQRRLKAAVVAEQMERLGGLPGLDVTVEELPGGAVGWRTRQRYAVAADGSPGLRRHRSHDVVPVQRCLLVTDAVDATGVTRRRWPDTEEILVAAAEQEATVAVRRSRDRSRRWQVISGERVLTEQAGGRSWKVAATGFWQVHPWAAETLAQAVLEGLQPRVGERCLDLYSGVGLFAGLLAQRVGASGRVCAVEGGAQAAALARGNLAALPQVSVRRSSVDPRSVVAAASPHESGSAGGSVDLVVLDPPRTGAGRGVVRAIAETHPRAIAYVACDPASLARDVTLFRAQGYDLTQLRAFDLFPMTHHVECVATLARRSAEE